MKEIIIFPFNYRGKTEFVLNGHFGQNPLETLYMAPHMSKIKDFKIKYHLCRPSESLLPATHSLRTLAVKLIDEFSEYRIISEVEKYMVILNLLKESRKENLSERNFSGIALAILQFIKDIKISSEKDIDYSVIRQGVRNYRWKFGYNLDILIGALEIMEQYEMFLKKEGLMDGEDVYREAVPYIDKIKWKKLVIEGFYEIPPYQKVFMKTLLEKVEDVSFSFCYDNGISADVRELILDRTLTFLKGTGVWKEMRVPGNEVRSRVECYNFSSQPEEIKGIVRLISGYLENNPGASFNDIMVVFSSMLAYRPAVQRIFGRYGLPCEIIPGYSLARDSSIATLLEFFSFRDTFDWEVLMNMLTSPHFLKMDSDKAEKFSAFSREKFERTGFFRDNFLACSDSNLDIIKSLLKKTSGDVKSCRKWIEDICLVIDKLGWKPGLPEVRYSFEAVLESLKTDVLFSLKDFLAVLMKSFELVEIQEGKGEGIKVSGVLESVGIEKKVCFIGGATEANIPQAPSVEELFIPDSLKKELGFTDYSLRIARERFDIYRLKNENEHVIFTYPSKIAGRNQMKSIFLFGQEESVPEEDNFTPLQKEIFSFDFSGEKFRKKFAPHGKLEISVTQLEMLLRCPYRFYMERVEGIEVYNKPEINEAPDLWGTVIHRVMQKIFAGTIGNILSPESGKELEDSFKNGLESEIEVLFKKGLISSFYMDVMKMRTGEVLNKFNEIIPNHFGRELAGIEEDISVELPSIILKGKIDRIEKNPSGDVMIIDIKTGTSKPPSYTEQNFRDNFNLQLPLYIWMYMKKFGMDKGSLSGSIWGFHFIEEDAGKSETVYKPSKLVYLDRVDDFLETVSEKIMAMKDFMPGKPGNCFFCPYKGMCPYEKN